MEQVYCNICGDKGEKLLFPSKSFMHPDETFTLVQCEECGLVFLNPRPALEEIGKYYENYHLHIDISNLSRLAKSILLVETIGNIEYRTGVGNDKFLEIGFGDGLFMEYMKNRKWDVYGIEIEAGCVNRLKKMGIKNVHVGDIFSHQFESETFDLIRMNHVLEHMHDPLKVLGEVKRILKRNGKLVIAVPNFDGTCHKIFKQHAYSLHVPFHLYFFTLTTLKEMIDKVGGFKIVNVRKNSSLILYLASIIQYLKRSRKADSSLYSFSSSKLILHRLFGLITLPFVKILDFFIEGDNLEIEIIRT